MGFKGKGLIRKVSGTEDFSNFSQSVAGGGDAAVDGFAAATCCGVVLTKTKAHTLTLK